jgi:hypothetical protein
MTDRPLITVPLDLIEDWRLAPEFCDGKKKIVMVTVSREKMQYITDQAAQWGADQELEACIGYVDTHVSGNRARALRTARRPKPPSLKEQALQSLLHLETGAHHSMDTTEPVDTIRRALEALDD